MDTQLENPAIPQLRELYNSSPAAREILASFADWENKKVTSVKRLHRRLARKGSAIDRPEIVQFFQSLHAMGLGEFLSGDEGRRPRFVWGYPLLDLPRVASGEAWELQPLQESPEIGNGHSEIELDEDDILEDSPVGDSRGGSLSGGSMIKHIYRLRGDYVVKLRLPMDLTPTEAGRLADFIKTLPFGR